MGESRLDYNPGRAPRASAPNPALNRLKGKCLCKPLVYLWIYPQGPTLPPLGSFTPLHEDVTRYERGGVNVYQAGSFLLALLYNFKFILYGQKNNMINA